MQSRVHYLGHIISPGLKAISAERVQLIKTMHTPETVTQLQSFWGWRTTAVGPRHLLNWTSEMKEHFDAWKIAITCTPALGLPDYSRPFHLHAGEAGGVAMVDSREW